MNTTLNAKTKVNYTIELFNGIRIIYCYFLSNT